MGRTAASALGRGAGKLGRACRLILSLSSARLHRRLRVRGTPAPSPKSASRWGILAAIAQTPEP